MTSLEATQPFRRTMLHTSMGRLSPLSIMLPRLSDSAMPSTMPALLDTFGLQRREVVLLRELIETQDFQDTEARLGLALGSGARTKSGADQQRLHRVP